MQIQVVNIFHQGPILCSLIFLLYTCTISHNNGNIHVQHVYMYADDSTTYYVSDHHLNVHVIKLFSKKMSDVQARARGVRDVALCHCPSCTDSSKPSLQFLCNFPDLIIPVITFNPNIHNNMDAID
jgi:hypothetical protein